MFRVEAVAIAFVLALPVFALAARGDFTVQETLTRLLWCIGAGWFAVGMLRWASQPMVGAGADLPLHEGEGETLSEAFHRERVAAPDDHFDDLPGDGATD